MDRVKTKENLRDLSFLSGLDSSTANNVIEYLHRLSKQGRMLAIQCFYTVDLSSFILFL